jgi:hypothetical protein
MKANLRVVRTPSDELREIVPALAAAEQEVARLRNELAAQGRLLAKERGVAFLRIEHLRQEFGQ